MKPQGFTLIEIAIVLVIIGLILGMVFKGKQLIDQTRVKQLEAQYTKIIGALETFHERYGFYPGDGCVNQTRTPATPFTCTGPKDGLLFEQGPAWGGYGNGYETEAAWYLLINVTGILTEADRNSIYGQPWKFIGGVNRVDNNITGTWLDLPGFPQADPRVICTLDQKMDDGDSKRGRILISDPMPYNSTTDCWSLSGQVNVRLQVLP
ncbi:MAG: prepilin-type N-terminal cleavage/methylation domain-containing protein [Desulfomicrobiaceae bacterium]